MYTIDLCEYISNCEPTFICGIIWQTRWEGVYEKYNKTSSNLNYISFD